MFRTIARRAAQSTETVLPTNPPPLTIHNNPYRTKKIWPPDYKELNFQQQLRFEKKYKRRILLATARPRWDKMVKLAQLGTTLGIVVYMCFFSEIELLGENYKPNERIRQNLGSIWGVFSEEKRYDAPSSALQPPPADLESQSSGSSK